jgi:hypothetical protein
MTKKRKDFLVRKSLKKKKVLYRSMRTWRRIVNMRT